MVRKNRLQLADQHLSCDCIGGAMSASVTALQLSPASAQEFFAEGKEWLGLAGVLAAHAAVLGAIWFSVGKITPPVTPPAVVGVLIAPTPPEITPPKPPTPKPPEPRPVVKPKPIAPPVKAPPSERAVTAPPPQPAAPREEVVPARPAPPAPAPAPEPIVPPRTDAAHLNNPAPAYPTISRRLGEEGLVLLDVHIQPDGSVSEIRLKRSSGFARLDDSAIEAVRRWRYVPARRGNEAIPFWYVQPIRFALDR